MTPFFQLLQQRVSAYGFSDSHISEPELHYLIKAACHAPSAYHLQNWHFTAVCSEKAKQALYHAAFSQHKIMQAAAVIVISGKLTGHQDLNEKLQASVQAGIIDNDTAQNWVSAAHSAFHNNPQAQRDEAIRSASLAAMTLMLAAQEQGWASCPMSGFDTEAVRQTAGLSENLLPVLLVAIGKTDGRQKQKIRAQAEWAVI
ncbi:nitroreductase family protein [Neisseria sp. 83E34]|uniref:nitroreductase family protein n=1 Tax=Neisseria sp. 83E34 TaxID=1692264 RepID=UPI0006CE6398|nr:nitroreductase family protein [Neisseria sp. 83E34]KPN71978.1 hypothetical protein AKG09_04620 [Neisseria sp. 83E34]